MQIQRDLRERSQRFPRSFSTCVVGVRGPQNKDFPSKTTRSLQDTPERGGAEAESSAAAPGALPARTPATRELPPGAFPRARLSPEGARTPIRPKLSLGKLHKLWYSRYS